MMKVTVGVHVFGNARDCPREALEKVDSVRDILLKTVEEAQLTAVGESFHQFEPVGVTGVIVLAESHISVHTWPEKGLVAVDVFTCGNEGDAEKAFDVLCRRLQAGTIEKEVVKR